MGVRELRPHPGPQERFLASTADEVLYGGAAGGGKSWALLMEASRNIAHPGYQGILLRRTYPELKRSLIPESVGMFSSLGTYNQADKRWDFYSGAVLWFGHMQTAQDMAQYQSAQFAFIGLDEATTFTYEQYLFMLSRLRNTHGIRNKMRLATNPGNVGHGWVKSHFVDRLSPYSVKSFMRKGERFAEVPAGTVGSMTRQFIPAKLEDNPTLELNDPGYRHRLAALPYRQRHMLLHGSWDVGYEGLVYADFDTKVHVIDAYPIPPEWRRIRAVDFGYRNAMVVQWWAITPDDEMILYREIYETGLLTSELGPRIREASVIETEDGIGAEDIEATIADHDADGRAELSRIHSIETVAAIKAIEDGIQVVETRLKIDKRGKSGLYIMRGATVRIDPILESESKPTSTLDEFALYQRPKAAGDKAEKEAPLDLNNHGMDAMRYAAQYLEHTETIVFEPSGHRGIAGSFPT